MKKIFLAVLLVVSLSFSGQTIKADTTKKEFIAIRVASNVFDTDAFVIITEDYNKALKFVNIIVDPDAKLSDFTDNEGVVFHNGTLPPVLWIPKNPNGPKELATLSHEIFHLVSTILRTRNIPLSDDTEEVYAYMIGFYSKMIYLNLLK